MTRVLLLTTGAANSVRTWSGTAFYIHEELKKNYDNIFLIEEGYFDKSVYIFRKFFNKFGWDIGREDIISHIYNMILRRKIREIDPDVVVSVASSQKIAHLKVDVPIVHISDATFACMNSYYQRNFKSLSQRSLKAGDIMEQHVLTNCAAALLSSKWAARSAQNDYNISPEKITVAQFGANVESPDRSGLDDVHTLDNINLLFIGVDWDRKGGDVAYDLNRSLNNIGIDSRLHVVGCTPSLLASDDPKVVSHGFLDKNVATDSSKLDALFKAADFLVVPSRQEAYGLVFAEAAAYGLPVLSTNTGGIPSVVDNGKTGILVDVEEGAETFVEGIRRFRDNPDTYRAMRVAARARYEEHLTWDAWGRKFDAVLRRLVSVQ